MTKRHPRLHPNWGFSVTPLDGENWLLDYDFEFNEVVEYPDGTKHRYQFSVPKGFIYDGSSVPKWARWFMQPMTGKHLRASLAHDLLYEFQQAAVDGTPRKIARSEADRVFRHVMLQDGFPPFKAKVAYSAVVAGGKKDWDTPTPEWKAKAQA